MVGLNAVCELGSFPVVAHVSERIIVRVSQQTPFHFIQAQQDKEGERERERVKRGREREIENERE